MTKLEELERLLKKYQKQYENLLKADKAATARYGNEDLTIGLKVLESAIIGVKKEIKDLRQGDMFS